MLGFVILLILAFPLIMVASIFFLEFIYTADDSVNIKIIVIGVSLLCAIVSIVILEVGKNLWVSPLGLLAGFFIILFVSQAIASFTSIGGMIAGGMTCITEMFFVIVCAFSTESIIGGIVGVLFCIFLLFYILLALEYKKKESEYETEREQNEFCWYGGIEFEKK